MPIPNNSVPHPSPQHPFNSQDSAISGLNIHDEMMKLYYRALDSENDAQALRILMALPKCEGQLNNIAHLSDDQINTLVRTLEQKVAPHEQA